MTHDINDVVERGMCVGCGACSIATRGAIPVKLGEFGLYEASLDSASQEEIEIADRVCPFSDTAKDEDTLASERFPNAPHADVVGRHMSIFAGRLTDDSRLLGSSSGGFTTLVVEELLSRNMVDAIIHVGRTNGSPIFSYQISHTVEELQYARKSAYFATTLTEILQEIQYSEKTYALVGLPCMIKAARLVADTMPEIDDRIVFYVGLICGHLKSQFFAESLGWQAGVAPDELASIDFRVKNPDRHANFYDYRVADKAGHLTTKSVRSTLDGSWGFGAFQPEACNFCDDLFAETADVVLGDAWLPQYKSDWRGTSLAVARRPEIAGLLEDAAARGKAWLEPLSVEDTVASQVSGVRHRRIGMQIRLADDQAAGLSVPQKRLPPGYVADDNRIALVRQRRAMSRMSLERFALARRSGDFTLYAKPMRAAIDRYRRIEARGQGIKGYGKYLGRKLLRRS